MRGKVLVLVTVALLCALPQPILGQEEESPLAQVHLLDPLETVAHTLMNEGLDRDALDLIRVMESLGYPAEKITVLRETFKGLRKRKPGSSLSDAARTLRSTADKLARTLRSAEGFRKASLAAQILRLDHENAEAREALGHVFEDGQWIDREEARRFARRGEIQEALQTARGLEVPIEVTDSDHPVLVKVYGMGGHRIRSGYLELHTRVSPEKISRVLRETLRALAYSGYLIHGKLALPKHLAGTWLILDSQEAYQRALDEAVIHGHLDEGEGERARKLISYIDTRGFGVIFDRFEASLTADFICSLEPHTRFAQPCLLAGHLNGVCLTYLGLPMPHFTWAEELAAGSRDARYATWSVSGELDRSSLYFALPRAGISGCRAWMAWQTALREDPLWSHSMRDQLGKIQNEDLIKTTLVTDFLQERGPLKPLIDETAPDLPKNQGMPAPALMEQALGEPLARFEERFRRWISAFSKGLALRAEEAMYRQQDKARKALLEQLNQWRRSSRWVLPDQVVRDLGEDPALTEGTAKHTVYLLKNPQQIEVWPDMHEEYVGQEGFSPEGAWSGAHSLIVKGKETLHQSLASWMGGFYHRLPLLQPGLLRVGWTFQEGLAVFDAGSLVVPEKIAATCVWPHKGMTEVPTRFAPELPNPVPEADPVQLGYPVTLQVWRPFLDLSVHMTLFKGKSGDRQVPCHYTSPDHPLNPELVPRNAYCLIPETRLKQHTHYRVQAEIVETGELITWSFKTGGR